MPDEHNVARLFRHFTRYCDDCSNYWQQCVCVYALCARQNEIVTAHAPISAHSLPLEVIIVDLMALYLLVLAFGEFIIALHVGRHDIALHWFDDTLSFFNQHYQLTDHPLSLNALLSSASCVLKRFRWQAFCCRHLFYSTSSLLRRAVAQRAHTYSIHCASLRWCRCHWRCCRRWRGCCCIAWKLHFPENGPISFFFPICLSLTHAFALLRRNFSSHRCRYHRRFFAFPSF